MDSLNIQGVWYGITGACAAIIEAARGIFAPDWFVGGEVFAAFKRHRAAVGSGGAKAAVAA